MIKCPTCGSSRVAFFRLDSDWGYAGNFTPANHDAEYDPDPAADYTPEDLEYFENGDRMDIRCHICMACETCFDGQEE